MGKTTKVLVDHLRTILEKQGYDVCSRLAFRWGLKADFIRLFFIYATFFAVGSPIILYFFIATALKIKDYYWARKVSVFDL